MKSHWLLWTSDREAGGHVTLGIFESEEAAWGYYRETHQNDSDSYYRIPSVEEWIGHEKQKVLD